MGIRVPIPKIPDPIMWVNAGGGFVYESDGASPLSSWVSSSIAIGADLPFNAVGKDTAFTHTFGSGTLEARVTFDRCKTFSTRIISTPNPTGDLCIALKNNRLITFGYARRPWRTDDYFNTATPIPEIQSTILASDNSSLVVASQSYNGAQQPYVHRSNDYASTFGLAEIATNGCDYSAGSASLCTDGRMYFGGAYGTFDVYPRKPKLISSSDGIDFVIHHLDNTGPDDSVICISEANDSIFVGLNSGRIFVDIGKTGNFVYCHTVPGNCTSVIYNGIGYWAQGSTANITSRIDFSFTGLPGSWVIGNTVPYMSRGNIISFYKWS